MSVELPLSTKTLLVLNPSIMTIMTRGRHRVASHPWRLLLRNTCPGSSAFASRLVDHEHYLLAFGMTS